MVVEASGLPVIADADTGYGSPCNVVRTVRAYERAGVAAIQLEDQAFPKRCGHLAGKELSEPTSSSRKLHAALDARRADTVIIARTDARGAGRDRGSDRAGRTAYAAEGADMIFVEAPQSVDEIEQIAAEVDAPLLFNVVPGGTHPEIADDAPGPARLPARDLPRRGCCAGASRRSQRPEPARGAGRRRPRRTSRAVQRSSGSAYGPSSTSATAEPTEAER